MLTKSEELAYLAGYFDGEGCICFLNKNRRYPSLALQVSTADLSILRRFARMFGGRVIREKSLDTKRAMYRWYKHGKHAQEVLTQLIPYLHGKLYPAILANSITLGYNNGNPVPPWQVKAREDVYTKVKAFNNRVTNPDRLSPS